MLQGVWHLRSLRWMTAYGRHYGYRPASMFHGHMNCQTLLSCSRPGATSVSEAGQATAAAGSALVRRPVLARRDQAKLGRVRLHHRVGVVAIKVAARPR